jgi:hypothetical protein
MTTIARPNRVSLIRNAGSLMSQPPKQHVPARYQFRVDGHLDAHWSAWFDDLTMAQEDDGTTTLTGLVQDQPQLHGLLAKIRDLGITLVRLELIEDVADEHPTSDKGGLTLRNC